MTLEEIKAVIEKHRLWMSGASGEKADLCGVNLSGFDLSWCDLSWFDLSGADLRGANLSWSDLRGANLCGSDLRGANLIGANLSWSDLRGANLDEAVARLDFGGWSVCVRHDSTSIGCKTCANEKWLEWSPDDVAAFDVRAKEWWQTHGDAIKAVIRCVMEKHAATRKEKTV